MPGAICDTLKKPHKFNFDCRCFIKANKFPAKNICADLFIDNIHATYEVSSNTKINTFIAEKI